MSAVCLCVLCIRMSVHVMPLLFNMNAASAETASQQAARGDSSVPLCFGMPRLRLFAGGTGVAAACMYRCRYKVGVTVCLACNIAVLPHGCHMAVRGTLHKSWYVFVAWFRMTTVSFTGSTAVETSLIGSHLLCSFALLKLLLQVTLQSLCFQLSSTGGISSSCSCGFSQPDLPGLLRSLQR